MMSLLSHLQSLRILHCSITFWTVVHSHFSHGIQSNIFRAQNCTVLQNFWKLLWSFCTIPLYSSFFYFHSALPVCLLFPSNKTPMTLTCDLTISTGVCHL